MQTAYMSGGHVVSDDTYSSLYPSLKKLGKGVHRETFALSDEHVLKIAHDGKSSTCRANKEERDSWTAVSETKWAEHFAPVVACSPSGAWLVMERVKYVAQDETFEESPTYDEWKHDVCRTVERATGLIDTHSKNIGWTGSKWVIIDYGFGLTRLVDSPEQCDSSDQCDSITPRCSQCDERECVCVCDCESCQRSRHKADSCVITNSEHPTRQCWGCGVSACACSATACILNRDSRCCDARDSNARKNCCAKLAHVTSVHGHRMVFCSEHMPVWPVRPPRDIAPRLFASHIEYGWPA